MEFFKTPTPPPTKKVIRITLADGTVIDRDYQQVAELSKLPIGMAANSREMIVMMMGLAGSGILADDPRNGPNYSRFIGPGQIKQVEVIFPETKMTVQA